MSYNINDAFLADKVYGTKDLARATVLVSPDGTRWVLELKSSDRKDGYQGALFRNAGTGEFKFASRGTEPLREPLLDLVIANLQMGFQILPDQMVSQRLFFQEVTTHVRAANVNPSTITLVGDSLGGSLVTLLGVENPRNAVHAFNPYGVGNLVPPGSYNNVTSHVLARDPVVVLPGSKTVGVTYMYNEPDNPRGSTTPSLASHTNRSLWQLSAVGSQQGATIVVDAFTPLKLLSALMGPIFQREPFTGLPSLIHIPQRAADGSFTYTFDSGYQCTTNPVSGEFIIRVPNGQGGFVTYTYTRESADEMGYTVRRTTRNAQGSILEEVTGYQTGLSAWAPSRLDRSSFSQSTVQQCRRLFEESQFTSPLILDLDGNGVVATRKLGQGTYFDHDGNGLAESTGWVGSGDALLVRDLNGNGRIDDGNELFGNQTDLAPGVNPANAANGFAALATLDTNGDGQVSAQDGSSWSSLQLWRDLNGNGLNEAGELISLAEAGIGSLGIAYSTNATPADAQGNEHRQLGQFTRSDGSTGAMHDVWFACDAVVQRDAQRVDVSDAIAALPAMQGLGHVRSLRQTMARDASGHLQALVQIFVAGDGSGGPGTRAQAEAILQAWTGADRVSGMRGTVDARKVAALEALMADTYYNVNWSSRDPIRPVQTAQVHQAYDALLADLYAKLLAQTQFRPLLASVACVFGADGSLSVDVQATRALLQDKYTQSPVATEQLMTLWGQSLMDQGVWGRQVFDALVASGSPTGTGLEQVLARMGFEHVTGTATDDVLTAAAGDQPSLLRGAEGNDQVTGSVGNDVLEGGEGADTLEGGLGNDLLVGGAGNDVLRGGQGDDSYVYARGEGVDEIIDFVSDIASTEHALGGSDTLFLRGGILASQTQAFREDDDLVLQLGPCESIRVVGHFIQGLRGGRAGWLERVVFEDGTQWSDWSTATARKRVHYQFGSSADEALSGGATSDEIRAGAGNDIITGNGGEDALYGEDGNDVLDSGAGDDTLAGGAGNDTLYGGGSEYSGGNSDTYLFNLGDGVDTVVETGDYYGYNTDALRFGEGIAPADVAVVRVGNHLELRLANGVDKVIVQDWFTTTSARGNKLEQVQFADGTAWTARDLQWMQTGVGVNVTGSGDLRGTASTDTLTANGYGTSLQGGAGHDILNAQQRTGLVWNLTFNGGPGNDQITGSYAKDTYVFNRGDGWDTISDDLRFYPGTSAPAYFASNPNAPEYQDRVQFGSSIDASQLWFQRAGDDLQVSLVGATDGMTLTGWYTSMFREIEEFRLQDGRMLRNEDVNSLVQAMAAFSPPPAGQTHLPQDYQSELGGVIAANWR